MAQYQIDSFNSWIGWALGDLALAPGLDAPRTRQTMIEMTIISVKHALKRANQMGCPARQALCLRVLNWLRADLRRLPS